MDTIGNYVCLSHPLGSCAKLAMQKPDYQLSGGKSLGGSEGVCEGRETLQSYWRVPDINKSKSKV